MGLPSIEVENSGGSGEFSFGRCWASGSCGALRCPEGIGILRLGDNWIGLEFLQAASLLLTFRSFGKDV